MQRFLPVESHRQLASQVSSRRTWLACSSLLLLVAFVYWPTVANGFVSDDVYYIKDNVALRSLSGLANIWFKLGTTEQYYPLVHSTFWAEYHLWGLDPRGFHVVNFLLHTISVVLVWRLLVRLQIPGAWLAAAIFAVHPVEVESVAWASERKNVLSWRSRLDRCWPTCDSRRPKPTATGQTKNRLTRRAGGTMPRRWGFISRRF